MTSLCHIVEVGETVWTREWVSLVGKVITWKDTANSPVWPLWTMTSLCRIAEVGDERVGITCGEGDYWEGQSQLTHLSGLTGL